MEIAKKRDPATPWVSPNSASIVGINGAWIRRATKPIKKIDVIRSNGIKEDRKADAFAGEFSPESMGFFSSDINSDFSNSVSGETRSQQISACGSVPLHYWRQSHMDVSLETSPHLSHCGIPTPVAPYGPARSQFDSTRSPPGPAKQP